MVGASGCFSQFSLHLLVLQLWSRWPADLKIIKFTHIQYGACLVFSLPFPLPLSSLHFLFCSLYKKRTIIQFCSGCHSKDKYPKTYSLYFMFENLNLNGQSLIYTQNSKMTFRSLSWPNLMVGLVKLTFGHIIYVKY